MLNKISKTLTLVNEWVGQAVSWLTLAMVLTTFIIVVLRYLFNSGWIAMQESVTYMHAFVFMLAAGYTFKHEGHVRVDIFYQQFNDQRKAWVNLLGNILFLMPVCVFIINSSWDYVAQSWTLKESSREAGGLPLVFILKTTIPLMAILLLIQAINNSIQNLLILLPKTNRITK